MLVYNSVTRDSRVMREASTLQAAGHEVTVVGVPDSEADAPFDTAEEGVAIHRVHWQEDAMARARRSAPLRLVPSIILTGFVIWGFVVLPWIGKAVLAVLLGVALLYIRRRMRQTKVPSEAVLKHWAEALFAGTARHGEFPPPKSLFPAWIPEILLELALEPVDQLRGPFDRFVRYRYRAQAVAQHAIALKPDVIHAHDCTTLPAAVAVKKALGIPLVYDAHEIYEASAGKRLGAVDYYIRIHQRFLRYVDRFITINRCAAAFYRDAYPFLPPAVILRNAALGEEPFAYDGRLHDAAGLPRSEKILLYQGSYTGDRGLETLVRAGNLLPDGWTLVMMGWGPTEQELRRIAGASPKVRFVPAAPRLELGHWTAGASAGIIPYEGTVLNHWICTPNKLWEYPNVGVPLIVQPFPELRDVVETYGCGWVMPEETPESIAALVESLTGEMLVRAHEACRRFIEADSWEAAYRQKLIDLYGSIPAAKAAA
ncbi:MAG TPA: glycosyltransferase [Rhizomicrobium sp.]|nr:glycosyltransferase [Rhizomicrobium sp.]